MNDNILNGVIPVNKQAGMTSHDVVHKLRKILGTKKIGHTGTLDPEVTGVLPITIGKATKLSDYISSLSKSYSGQMTIGIGTTTEDFTGDVIEEKKVTQLSEQQIVDVFKSFIGELDQIPPMYSSVKQNGKKLYELARQGKVVERQPKKIYIYELEILNIDLEQNNPTVDFAVTCSKGTYVRTLCVDIGKALGYPAHMSSLVRTASGPFQLEQTYSLAEIETYVNENRLDEIITPMASALPNFREIQLNNLDIENKIYNGQAIVDQTIEAYEGIIKILNTQGELVALYETRMNDSRATAKRVFKL